MTVVSNPVVMGRTDARRSGNAWRGHDLKLANDPNYGIHYFFEPSKWAANQFEVGEADTAPVLSDTIRGRLAVASGGTDNNQGGFSLGGADTGHMCLVNGTQGRGERTILETKGQFSSIVDQAFFFGFGDPAMAAADPLADNSGAVPDKDLFGFRILTADPDGLDFVHRATGESEVVNTNEAQVVVAETDYNLAILYNPRPPLHAPNVIEAYVNNVLVAEYTYAEINVSTFPKDVHLVPMIWIKTGASGTKIFNLASFDYGLVFGPGANN